MKIYSTRHGETLWNSQNKILGITDIKMTEKGIAQAQELAEKVRQIGDVQVIVSSPMQRARQTAKIIGDMLEIPIINDKRFREWHYGEYEGMYSKTDGFYDNKRNFAVKMKGGGESLLQLSHRVYSALDDIIKKYHSKNVLIVSHGGVCRIIETYFKDMTIDEFSNWFMGNCQLIEYYIL